MKKVLNGCGTVMYLNMNADDVFADIKVDLSTGDLSRLLEEFISSLPPSLNEKFNPHYSKIKTLLFNRVGNFEIDIKPVMNKTVLKKANCLVE